MNDSSEWRCNACGKVFGTEAEAAGCLCPMHTHARTKVQTPLELDPNYRLWPGMAKAGFPRLTQANIEAYKKGLRP